MKSIFQADAPIFFAPARVWRCYTGGLLLDRFTGRPPQGDGHLPEDWLASVVRAVNGKHSLGPDEGLARALNADGSPGPFLAEWLDRNAAAVLGAAHARRYGASMALLCKYLDSAVRLPIQCHPDRETARRLYGSRFGKTECWHILDTRAIRGRMPYLLMGFRPGVSREAFARAVQRQDAAAMEGMLHRTAVKPGETYFVPARMPHAIGTGVFMLEVQEPSDLVIQPEAKCADTRLSRRDMWGPLTPAQGLDVFDYTGRSFKELMAAVRVRPRPLRAGRTWMLQELVGPDRTAAFGLWQVRVQGAAKLPAPPSFAVVVVTRGRGVLAWPGGRRPIRRGDYFLAPHGLRESLRCARAAGLTLLYCLPPADR